jgi:ketosteroid isomerase-like protein
MDLKSIQGLAYRYGKAWAAYDLDAVMALHTEDSVFQIHGDNGVEAVGAAAVRTAFEEALARSPDLRFEPTRVYFGETSFISQYVMSGTVAGKPFRCDGVDIFAVRDGLVARKDTYADWIVYERQVGLPNEA